jgi:hypothetical protein
MPSLDAIPLIAYQRTAIANATAALLPPDRELFRSALAARLEGQGSELGDGSVARAIRALLTTCSYRCAEIAPRPSKLLLYDKVKPAKTAKTV